MLQDSSTIKFHHEQFVKTICETEIVYALKNANEYATTSSNYYDDENDEPLAVICFWSEKTLAKSCIQNEWSSYKIEAISLSDFVENWCIRFGNDGLIIGTNFDNNMFGHEAEPYELILEIARELKKQKKTLEVKNYENLEELTSQLEAYFANDEDDEE
jgi:hypothetical protein